VLKEKHAMQQSFMAPRTVSVEFGSQGEGQPSMGTQTQGSQGRGKRNMKLPPTPTSVTRSSPLGSTSAKKPAEKASEQSGLGELSYADLMAMVPQALQTDRRPDYKTVSAVYKRFWETCTDAYFLGVNEKKVLPLEQFTEAPAEFNIRVLETHAVESMMNWLVNMPDKSTKQTLCVMPVGLTKRPTKWEDVEHGLFYIINGQHSVAASRMMMEDNSEIDETTQKEFEKWNCFIVWSNDAEKLRSISAYYNRVNHFQAIQPSWATNILGARTVWVNMGSPKNPKDAVAVGTVQMARRNRESLKQTTKFRVSNSDRVDLNCSSSGAIFNAQLPRKHITSEQLIF